MSEIGQKINEINVILFQNQLQALPLNSLSVSGILSQQRHRKKTGKKHCG